MSKWSETINYLSYVDDIINFEFSDRKLLQLLMDVCRNYEAQSRQLIKKRVLFVYHKTIHAHIRKVEECSSFIKEKK